MPPPPERRWLGVLLRRLGFAGLVVLVTAPIWFAVGPAPRPALARLAAALILGPLLLDLIRVARARLAAQPASTFDAALSPAPAPAGAASRLGALRDEVRFAAASQSYFDRVFWPRLGVLAGRLPHRSLTAPPGRPRGRRLLRRGPSVAALHQLLARLEDPP